MEKQAAGWQWPLAVVSLPLLPKTEQLTSGKLLKLAGDGPTIHDLE